MATRHMPFEPDGERGGRLTIRLPRPDIADLLATSVESISRISQKLAAEGLIAIISPGLFHIPDVQRLAQRGCLNDPAAAGSTQIKAAQRAPGLPMQDRVSQIA
jgi:CRP/FNR family transcriptional regulator